MGWLKNIFLKKQEEEPVPVKVRVDASRLASWFDDQVHKKFEGLREDVSGAYRVIDESVPEVKKSLDVLNIAQLRNPNIPEKAKNIMDGNRSAYIKQYRLFLDSLEVPEEVSYYNTTEFCERFSESMEKLVQSCQRNTAILNEFFANELKEINRGMKKIADSVEFIKEKLSSEKQDLVFIEGLKEDIASLKNKLIRKKELEKEIYNVKEKKKISEELKVKIERQGNKLRQSPAYAELVRLQESRDRLREEESRVRGDISHLFAQIDKALKRYQRVSVESSGLIQSYIDDSASALAEDEHLKIVNSLVAMRLSIENDQLDVKDKEKEKLMQRAAALDKDSLESFRTKLLETVRSRKKVEEQCNSSGVLREMDDVAYKMQHTIDQLNSYSDKIDLAEKNILRLALDDAKSRLEEQLGFFLKGEVSIVLGAADGSERYDN